MHIQNIISSLKPLMSTAVTAYKDLPITCQMRVLNSRALAAISQLTFWKTIIDDESKSPEQRKRAAYEINLNTKVLNSILPVVKAAAHYRDDGESREVKFDTAYVDELGIPTGDIEYSDVVVAGHPHAWVQVSLINQGINFDEIKADMNHELLLNDVERVYAKAAATYIAQLILIEHGLFTPPTSDRGAQYMSDNILLASNSTTLKDILKHEDGSLAQQQAILRVTQIFARYPFKNTRFVQGSDEAIKEEYLTPRLYTLWKELVEQDEETAFKEQEKALDAQAKLDTRTLVRNISNFTRDVVMKTTIANKIGEAAVSMKKSGLSDELISNITAQMMQMMTPPEAPKADVPQAIAQPADTATATS